MPASNLEMSVGNLISRFKFKTRPCTLSVFPRFPLQQCPSQMRHLCPRIALPGPATQTPSSRDVAMHDMVRRAVAGMLCCEGIGNSSVLPATGDVPLKLWCHHRRPRLPREVVILLTAELSCSSQQSGNTTTRMDMKFVCLFAWMYARGDWDRKLTPSSTGSSQQQKPRLQNDGTSSYYKDLHPRNPAI